MNGGEEISGELVVACRDAPKILEPTETALDDIAPPIGSLVEAVPSDAVGFIGDDGLGAALLDRSAQRIAVIAFICDDGPGLGGERQDIGRSSDIGVLTGRQVENDRPAQRIAQSMDFGGAATARAADRLTMLPPFPPEAQR